MRKRLREFFLSRDGAWGSRVQWSEKQLGRNVHRKDSRPVLRSARAGWPRVVAHPGLPQIRTCAINAYGSSGYGFAGRRYTEWTTTAPGSGCRSRSRLNRGHGMSPARRRRDSHLCQMRTTSRRNRHSAAALLVIP